MMLKGFIFSKEIIHLVIKSRQILFYANSFNINQCKVHNIRTNQYECFSKESTLGHVMVVH